MIRGHLGRSYGYRPNEAMGDQFSNLECDDHEGGYTAGQRVYLGGPVRQTYVGGSTVGYRPAMRVVSLSQQPGKGE
jgi:hypothetical protein